MSPTGAGNTKARILDAAERLFADQGFAATSLRAITTAAGVNLAAVHYHFGSKEALIDTVFARRLDPLNLERIRRLDALETGSTPPGPEPIVHAFLAPALRMCGEAGSSGRVFVRLLGQAMNQPDERIRAMLARHFAEVLRRYPAALGHALPDLPRDEVFWRFLFTVGAMAHPLSMLDYLERLSGGLCDPSDVEEMTRRMVDFCVAGLRAPAPVGAEERP